MPHHLINGRIAAKHWFQPQVGVTFRTGRREFFANHAENMRACVSSFRGPFGTTQAGFEAIRGVEVGARYRVSRALSLIGSYS